MPSFRKTHRIAHSAQQMFDLVADVESYPSFLPLCTGLSVLSRRTKGDREALTATMSVGYKRISETFTTQVILNRPKLAIDVQYIDGPFKYLVNEWRFEPDGPDRCLVHFFIDYEFRSRTLGLMMGSMFDRAFNMFVQAFEERAAAVYGPSINDRTRRSEASADT